MKISKEQLSEMRGRAEKACFGPWYYSWPSEDNAIRNDGGVVMTYDNVIGDDIEFITQARTDIPLLIEALESAYALIEKKDNALRKITQINHHGAEGAVCGTCIAYDIAAKSLFGDFALPNFRREYDSAVS